jgi:Histidine kinase-, DNA gyrase B-, and HSP90-like ATPase
MTTPKITRVAVAVQSDFMQKQAATTPLQALAECIWNGLDADASKVEVEIERNPIGLQSITIRDNGTGIPRNKAPELFSKLGDSWKRRRGRTEAGRELHGSEGRGRYKVTVLGRVADWRVTYKDDDGTFKRFVVTVIRDDLRDVAFTEDVPADADHTGVELVITEPLSDFRSLQSEDTPQQLAEIFATYLRKYTGITVSLQGIKLDPAALMASVPIEMNLLDIQRDGKQYPARLEIVEWKRKSERVLYLCDDRGFPMLNFDTRWHVGERFFSAYLRSALIRDMSDRNEIGLAEMDPSLAATVEEARARIKDHFRAKTAEEAQEVVKQWKAEKVYPYSEPAETPVQQVSREVFDIMATTAVRYLDDFGTSSTKSRAFQLRMMRTAIENGSDELQLIMKEVLNLPARMHEELAKLIQDSSLPAIINASKVVTGRLKFLTALDTLIFDKEIGATLRERSQLHRILADNTWLFGEEHHLMVDDRSLDECLKQHTGAKNISTPKGRPVLHPTKTRGIVDLMFGKRRTGYRPEDLEHLIVELKSPKVTIGREEIAQIEGYVGAVTGDSRFDTSTTKWNFWALSRKVDDKVMRIRQVQHADPGVIIKQDNLVVVVRTWAQVIGENRARMKFFEENLDLTVTKADALRHLRERYAGLFKGTLAGEAIDKAIENGDAEPDDAGIAANG